MGETRPLRAGEEIDLGALNAFLASHAPQVGHVAAVEQFPGGFSNLTYLLKTDRGEVVLRRPPRGVAKGSAHDMGREHRILATLSTRRVPAPRPVVLCDDESVLGAPFYIMERVRGVILRGEPREPPSPEVMRLLS
ncbi:MAG TPA: phosphotransferase family protein, partial [Gemmatimonadaceae bacterium]|nr:phosphotransferase family protein [Gemmatimonadaceae bacterium]